MEYQTQSKCLDFVPFHPQLLSCSYQTQLPLSYSNCIVSLISVFKQNYFKMEKKEEKNRRCMTSAYTINMQWWNLQMHISKWRMLVRLFVHPSIYPASIFPRSARHAQAAMARASQRWVCAFGGFGEALKYTSIHPPAATELKYCSMQFSGVRCFSDSVPEHSLAKCSTF